MQTEFSFQLPHGYVDPDGKVHADGVMRLARAGDEVLLLEDPRVQSNRAYLVVLLMARVLVRLGTLEGDEITEQCIEGLFSADLAYLQRFYRRINGLDAAPDRVCCPQCQHQFELKHEVDSMPSSAPDTRP